MKKASCKTFFNSVGIQLSFSIKYTDVLVRCSRLLSLSWVHSTSLIFFYVTTKDTTICHGYDIMIYSVIGLLIQFEPKLLVYQIGDI